MLPLARPLGSRRHHSSDELAVYMLTARPPRRTRGGPSSILTAASRLKYRSVMRASCDKLVWRVGRHVGSVERPVADPKVQVEDLVQRNFTASAPDQKWFGDITYIHTWEGWLYLAVILDAYRRKVVGWAMADHLRTELATDALKMALSTRRPKPGLIHHTDRGSQYTSSAYGDLLRAHQVRQSIGRPGTCWDNAVAESFFATLKTELIYRQAGLLVARRNWPSLNSSPAGTTSTVAIPPWATPAPPKSNGAFRLLRLRPNKPLHRSGASPCVHASAEGGFRFDPYFSAAGRCQELEHFRMQAQEGAPAK
jgi:transposase InsO family protein